MAVGPDAEQRQIAPVADGRFVRAAGLVDVAREIEAMEARRRQIDAREQEALEHLVAAARIARVHAAELVEQEHLGPRERHLAGGDRLRNPVVDRHGREPGRQADAQRRAAPSAAR